MNRCHRPTSPAIRLPHNGSEMRENGFNSIAFSAETRFGGESHRAARRLASFEGVD